MPAKVGHLALGLVGANRGDSTGRCNLVSAGRQALARCDCDDRDDPYRHRRDARWPRSRMAGKGHRRAVLLLKTK